jgi:short-subunit dehydrogenase
VFGEFVETDLDKELTMINTNITCLHILMKKFLVLFKERDRGYILNVASSAAFLPGPLLSSYYATKAYVLRLTQAVCKELSLHKSNVYVGALCPGPVDTQFKTVAGVQFNLKGLTSPYVVDYAIKKMFRRKTVIIPGFAVRMGAHFARFVPTKLLLEISYRIQRKKG